jgi:hypothetical protein
MGQHSPAQTVVRGAHLWRDGCCEAHALRAHSARAQAMQPLITMRAADVIEVGFDLTYLAAIVSIVALMTARLASTPDPKGVLHLLRNGFALLALGDSGHVGLRVVALMMGDVGATVTLGGTRVALIGVGALATAITITLLYMLLVEVWRLRFEHARDGLFWALQGLGLVRLALFVAPQNDWGAATPPWGWSVLRNAPLLMLGVTLASVLIHDGRRAKDTTFTTFGWLIALSYAFYLPVILFVQRVPLLGMLMVPKTIVYLVMACLAYVRLFVGARPPLRVSAASP